MGSIREFNLVKLFIGILVSDVDLTPQVEQRLAAEYGAIDQRSDFIPFTFTASYEREMGRSIHRVFVSFEPLIGADRLPEIKRKTNALEKELAGLAANVKRPLNLDPGYLENAKVVLASTKNFYHRIYLGGGIFGEVTMHFRNHACEFFPWTYPDYQSPAYQDFFLRIRRIYRDQLRNMCLLKPKED